MNVSKPPCQATQSATANTACLGCGSAARTLVRPCKGRFTVVAWTAHARWCSPFAAVCWAETLPVIAAEAGRALGPVLPSSAREHWPFCVLRDSCHAALPDQPGSPSIGSGRWTGGSCRRPRVLRIISNDHCVDAVGILPSCESAPQSGREKVIHSRIFTILAHSVAVWS